jgi:uncharacterized membrane protein
MRKPVVCVAAALAAWFFASSARAQHGPPRVIGVGGRAIAVSGDGFHVAVDQSLWTEAGGLIPLPLIGTTFREADGLSFDGSFAAVTGMVPGNRAARVHGSSVLQLGTLPGYEGAIAIGISSDASVIACATTGPPSTHGFFWTAAAGLTPIGVFPGGTTSYPQAISSDGRVLVGLADRPGVGDVAFRWTQAGGLEELGRLPNEVFGSARATSSNGSVVFGFSQTASNDDRPTRWTRDTGMVQLPSLPGYGVAYPDDATPDGQVAVGIAQNNLGDVAVLWSPDGIHRLSSVLDGLGVPYPGWQFEDALGISDDGTVVVGQGRLNGSDTGFVVIIPAPAGACLLVPAMLVVQRRRRVRPAV